MKNAEIKSLLKKENIHQWMVAEAMSIGETTLSRKMRNELPEEEKQQILDVIEKLKESKVQD